MVQLETVRSANLDLVNKQSLVAVFAGGTSGIGQYTVEALARTHANIGKGLRIYIVGRNEKAAEKIIAGCQDACPSGSFRFVKADDLSLLNNVDVVCKRIIELEQREEQPRIDILVMSQGCSIWKHQESVEGLDILSSLLYYSRIRMTTKLIPLLTASVLPAHVISIYAAGFEKKIITDDLTLRKPGNWSLAQNRSHVVYMTTLYMESLAKQYPGQLSMIHTFPGLVLTPGFEDPEVPRWFKIVWNWGGSLLARGFAIPSDESGQRILFLASPRYPARGSNTSNDDRPKAQREVVGTDGLCVSGAYAVNWDGETISVAKAYRKKNKGELSTMILDHTHRAFEQIEKGQTFKE